MSASARNRHPAVNDRSIVRVMDDDVSRWLALSLLFPSVGLNARTYKSAQEFLDASDHDGPACLLLDVRPPGSAGLISIGTRLAPIFPSFP